MGLQMVWWKGIATLESGIQEFAHRLRYGGEIGWALFPPHW